MQLWEVLEIPLKRDWQNLVWFDDVIWSLSSSIVVSVNSNWVASDLLMARSIKKLQIVSIVLLKLRSDILRGQQGKVPLELGLGSPTAEAEELLGWDELFISSHFNVEKCVLSLCYTRTENVAELQKVREPILQKWRREKKKKKFLWNLAVN